METIRCTIKLPELKEILRQNNLKGYSHYGKKQLVTLLSGKGLLPYEEPKPIKVKSPVDPKYARLENIRTSPKRVVLKSIKTDEEFVFSSIYKAAKFIDRSPRIITFWNGRVWNSKYTVTITEAAIPVLNDPVIDAIKDLESEITSMYDSADKLCEEYLK